MMNTIVGSALGGLVAAAIALMASGQTKSAPAPYFGTDANAARAMTVADTRALSQGSAVQCQPYEEAVLRRAFVNGREMAEVTCITRMNDRAASYQPQAYAQQPVYVAQPVVRTVQRPVQRPVARQRTAATQVYEEDRRADQRSWGKTAMIIGGSSGAGAGVGALVGGKKGALIGAAIGGGAATIYESTKR